jgi:hypothetical protein
MRGMVLKTTSTPYYLISEREPFQNGGRLNFYGGVHFEMIVGFE